MLDGDYKSFEGNQCQEFAMTQNFFACQHELPVIKNSLS